MIMLMVMMTVITRRMVMIAPAVYPMLFFPGIICINSFNPHKNPVT